MKTFKKLFNDPLFVDLKGSSTTGDGGISFWYNVGDIHYEIEVDYDGEISLSIKELGEEKAEYLTLFVPDKKID